MAFSGKLPRLPLPSVNDSIKNYLLEVERLTPKLQFDQTLQNSKSVLEDSNVRQMQNHLLRKYEEEDNWLANYWLKLGYLKLRDSLVINTSPGLLLAQKNPTQTHYRKIGEILQAIINYNELIERKMLKTETMGGAPLCMEQYRHILGVYRVPIMGEDQLFKFRSRHIVLAYKNGFYRMDLYDQEGRPFPLPALERQIHQFVADHRKSPPEPKVGILTSWSRDEWSRVYSKLFRNSTNKKSVLTILNSLCILSLDSDGVGSTLGDARDTLLGHMLHGQGHFTANRWFDKTLQVVYRLDDGYFGFTYEHTPAEGVALARLAEMMVAPDALFEDKEYSPLSGSGPTKLVWELDEDIEESIDSASLYIQKKIDNVCCRYVMFDQFGKAHLKSLKVSPDAFIQVAFQLAYYRLNGDFTATYESGSTRKFRSGRTDTIRSCTSSACAFVEKADLPSVPHSVKRSLLRDAISAHSEVTKRTMAGEGPDRHLSALKWAGLENGLAIPPFFSDEAFKKYFMFKMSTSQVPLPGDAVLVFGPACLDGYGICYNPQNDYIVLSLTSFLSSGVTNVDMFKRAICNALTYQSLLLKE